MKALQQLYKSIIMKALSKKLYHKRYIKALSLKLYHESLIKRLHVYTQQTFVFMKTSSRGLDQDENIRLTHTSSRRLQDVLQKCLQDIFKTSSRRFQDVFKTSCKDIFKTFSRRIIKLNCSC